MREQIAQLVEKVNEQLSDNNVVDRNEGTLKVEDFTFEELPLLPIALLQTYVDPAQT